MKKQLDILESGRLVFRGLNETDTEEVLSWRGDPKVYRYFKSPHKITRKEHENWYRTRYVHDPYRHDYIGIDKESGRKAGLFGLIRSEKGSEDAEVHYILDPAFRGRGYASEAVIRLVRHAREDWGTERVFAEIHRDNTASCRLVERLGFTVSEERGDFLVYELKGGGVGQTSQTECDDTDPSGCE